jgi:hypothetical protein
MVTTTYKTLASEKTKFKEHSFMRRTTIVVGSIFLLTLAAMAQENRSEISVQGTGFFTKSASGNGTAYSTSQTGGFLTTYRYHLNHWISAEAAYGYDLNSQKYLILSSSAFRIQSGIHQMTGSLVLNLPSRPSSGSTPTFSREVGRWCSLPQGTRSILCRERKRKPRVYSSMESVSIMPFSNGSRSALNTEAWFMARPTSDSAR